MQPITRLQPVKQKKLNEWFKKLLDMSFTFNQEKILTMQIKRYLRNILRILYY